jgi:fructosamine-3-kinase
MVSQPRATTTDVGVVGEDGTVHHLEAGLRAAVGAAMDAEVVDAAVVHGGDVAAAFRMRFADGRMVFAKTHPNPPAGFFTTEATGLTWLREPGVVAVPAVLAVSDGDPDGGLPSFLVLEWIDEGRSGPTTEADLGRALARLHAAGAPAFGREDRRTTGSRGLPNEPTATWAEFYATQRLLPLARLARDGGTLPDAAIAGLERLATAGRLASLPGAGEPPSRLHGDLWAGNRLVGGRGESWLIDPAAHGGHREFDLAMMRLFGGFGAACFAAYEEVAPLAPGSQDRVSLHQLAPLVVHAIKFGGGYVRASMEAVARWA